MKPKKARARRGPPKGSRQFKKTPEFYADVARLNLQGLKSPQIFEALKGKYPELRNPAQVWNTLTTIKGFAQGQPLTPERVKEIAAQRPTQAERSSATRQAALERQTSRKALIERIRKGDLAAEAELLKASHEDIGRIIESETESRRAHPPDPARFRRNVETNFIGRVRTGQTEAGKLTSNLASLISGAVREELRSLFPQAYWPPRARG